jgi:hypothetical protein
VKRTRRGALAGLSLVGLLVLPAACGGTSKATAPTTTSPRSTTTTAPANGASRLLSEVTRDATGEGWTHIDVTVTASGLDAVYSQDDGPQSGSQTITINKDLHLQFVLIDHTAYFKGDAGALTTYVDLPSSMVSKIAGRWVAVPSTDKAFASVSADLDITSVVAEITPSGPLGETAPTAVDGKRVVGITGDVPSEATNAGTCTLYVSVGAHPLPVAFAATDDNAKSSISFTNWGVSRDLAAPAGSILASSVGL